MEVGKNATPLIAGIDIPIPDLQTTIHQPKIKEIDLIGEQEYFFGVQMFCFNKDIIVAKNQENEAIRGLSNMNDFQIFMALISEKDEKSATDNRQKQIVRRRESGTPGNGKGGSRRKVAGKKIGG